MIYLVFNTKAQADAANTRISENMGFTGSITSSWAVPAQRVDNKWVFPKPDAWHMDGVNATEEEFDAEWFPSQGV